ncbi:MAG: hypothetical protein K2F57_00240, partial [Candidatus Gastranaerophilales bacterium]|nr:hypothetical protein [Candidatus Gastranaerophilales bacterium]
MSKVFRIAFNGENNTNLLKSYENKSLPNNKNEQLTITHPENKNNNDKTLKNLTYVGSAVALASLGVTTAFAIKNGKLNKIISKLEKKADDLGEALQKGLSDKEQEIKDLGKWQDGQIEGLRTQISTSIQS